MIEINLLVIRKPFSLFAASTEPTAAEALHAAILLRARINELEAELDALQAREHKAIHEPTNIMKLASAPDTLTADDFVSRLRRRIIKMLQANPKGLTVGMLRGQGIHASKAEIVGHLMALAVEDFVVSPVDRLDKQALWRISPRIANLELKQEKAFLGLVREQATARYAKQVSK